MTTTVLIASATCWWRASGVAPAINRIGSSATCSPTDPAFEQIAADVIGLYLNPPEHAVVVAVDEKTAIQALDRLDPVLPLSPGRAERHGFEYFRHGTLSLYAVLNTKTGEVMGQTVPRHTSAALVDFLLDVAAAHPRREIHVIRGQSVRAQDEAGPVGRPDASAATPTSRGRSQRVEECRLASLAVRSRSRSAVSKGVACAQRSSSPCPPASQKPHSWPQKPLRRPEVQSPLPARRRTL
jgi:hypothetical protein